jgi:membrane protein DedA with SNARE-associated domain
MWYNKKVHLLEFGRQQEVTLLQTLWSYFDLIVGFVKDNPHLAAPILFALAIAENMAFISLLIPATGIMIALGPVLAKAGIDPVPLVLASWAGAWIGFASTYWLGLVTTGERVRRWQDKSWVLYALRSSIPQFVRDSRFVSRISSWVARIAAEGQRIAEAFFLKWGMLGIFLGHFFGPVRGFISFVAGTSKMPQWKFHAANTPASFVWAVTMLALPLSVYYRQLMPDFLRTLLEKLT